MFTEEIAAELKAETPRTLATVCTVFMSKSPPWHLCLSQARPTLGERSGDVEGVMGVANLYSYASYCCNCNKLFD